MDCERIQAAVIDAVGGWVSCVPEGDDRYVLNGPGILDDGSHPRLMLRLVGDDTVVVDDVGSTLGRLEMAQVNIETVTFERALDGILDAYEVGLVDGALRIEGPVSDLGELFIWLTSAIVQVDGLRNMQGLTREERFSRQLATWARQSLPAPDYSVQEGFKVRGASRRYTINAAVDTPHSGQVLLQAASDSRGLEHAHYVYSDVDGIYGRTKKLTVLRGEPGRYNRADLGRLAEFSVVAAWKHHDRMQEYLSNAISDAAPNYLFPMTGRLF